MQCSATDVTRSMAVYEVASYVLVVVSSVHFHCLTAASVTITVVHCHMIYCGVQTMNSWHGLGQTALKILWCPTG